MRRIHSFTVLAATGMIGMAALAQGAPTNEGTSNQGQQPQQASEQSGNKQSQQAPEGWVLVDERVITLTANEPQNHFLRAHEYLTANDPKAAAAEVRIAAGYLDMQASRKGNVDQQELRSTSSELRQLANQIAQNGSPGEKAQPPKSGQPRASSNEPTAEQKQLAQAFAHADQVLARHFQQEASGEIEGHRPIMAGHDLDASAAALTASYAWSGEKCSKEAAQAISDAQRLSGQVLSPTPAGQAENTGKKTEDRETTGAESKGEAQPAAARISGNQSQNATETNRIPSDASKVVDELGKAIDSVSPANSSSKAGNEVQPSNEGQSKSPAGK